MKKLLLLFLLLPGAGFAQQATINGSEHPELIPDSAAALAVFSVHSMFGSAAVNTNTEKQHAKIGLSAADHAIYESAMQAHFNARSARNRSAQTATFGHLLATLSADGQARLKAFIRAEKKSMQYHVQEPIEQ